MLPRIDDLPAAARRSIDVVCSQFEQSWKTGPVPPRLEEYCTRLSGREFPVLFQELLYLDVDYRRRRGEKPTCQDYTTQLPHQSRLLAEIWPVLEAAEPGTPVPTRQLGPDRITAEARKKTTPAALPELSGYTIIAELGRGGMGVVYQARHAALDRLVALKMILDGDYAGAMAQARFQAEALAVARLQHPNIVQVYDIGEQAGRPYFAMEYVSGGSLAQHLAGTPQSAQSSALLIETLARAMHHAHQHGIIHRDLKPANILLSGGAADDGTPPLATQQLKITDFGLAKKLNDPNAQTRTGAVVGTPSYLAPEQALGQVHSIGPATDIYALGAILYEMLTGRPPFHGETPLDTMLQAVHEEPVPPRRLQSKVPRDLETICLKCLEKAPGKRYATALALAEDLQRFRDGKPILARPVGVVGRTWRWGRRNPLPAALAAGLLLALAGGLIASTALWWLAEAKNTEAQREKRHAKEKSAEAEQQKARALANEKKAREAVYQFYFAVSENDLLKQPNMKELRKTLLEKARRYYQEFFDNNKNDPSLRSDLAVTQHRLARVTEEIGSKAEALRIMQQALELYQQLVREDPTDPEQHEALAETHTWIGILKHELGAPPEEILPPFQEALTIRTRLGQAHPRDHVIQRRLAKSYHNVAAEYRSQGNVKKARDALEACRAIYDKLLEADPTNRIIYEMELAEACHVLGVLHHDAGKTPESLPLLKRARAIRLRLYQAHRTNIRIRQDLAQSCLAVGELLRQLRQWEEALTAYREGLDLCEGLRDENRSSVFYQYLLASGLRGQGLVQVERGQHAVGLESFQQAHKLLADLVQADPSSFRWHFELAKIAIATGIANRGLGNWDSAVRLLQQACSSFEKLSRQSPGHVGTYYELGLSYSELGKVHKQQGRRADALLAYQKAVEHARTATTRAPQMATYQKLLRTTEADLQRCRTAP